MVQAPPTAIAQKVDSMAPLIGKRNAQEKENEYNPLAEDTEKVSNLSSLEPPPYQP
jgi:hypothetical protein